MAQTFSQTSSPIKKLVTHYSPKKGEINNYPINDQRTLKDKVESLIYDDGNKIVPNVKIFSGCSPKNNELTR